MQAFPPGPPPGPVPTMVPPLPPGWTEHKAPSGVPYYYNSQTKQSTYTRPLPVMPPLGAPAVPDAATPAESSSSSKKKGKPKERIPIPDTTWLKVITTDNLVFYMNKETKKSSWVVPDEIKEEVEAYEAEQRAKRIRAEEEARLKREEEREAQQRERERIRKELEAERKALKERQQREREQEEQKRQAAAAAAEQERKRKAEVGEHDEGDQDSRPSKSAKMESDGNGAGDGDEEGEAGPVDEEDEEAWQTAVAAELAAEHAIANKEKKAQKAQQKEEEEAAKQKVFSAPAKVDLTAEEGRALFKALLYEKNISPFAPWETSLPLFINDPRYVLLSSQMARREVYEEYCREAARARRLGKSVGSSAVDQGGSGTSTEETTKKDPEKEYQALLKAEVKSTRSLWEDFRRAWKKDRRFFAFGKDDRQREKVFRQYQRELGERKRADAQRAEMDFMELLKEKAGDLDPKVNPDWRDVKRPLTSDARYDAVGSSSLREELFRRYLKDLATEAEKRKSSSSSTSAIAQTEEDVAARRAREKRERAEASIRERQQRVQGERAQIERDLQRSKLGASREEGERAFGSLLVQAVREHDASWSTLLPSLEADERFHSPALTMADKHRMFNAHLDTLARKRLDALHALFAQHAPQLNTPWEEVYPEIVDEFAVTRLKLSHDNLAAKYASWQKVRFARSREEFDKLLGENSFVDFWGRMRNKQLDAGLVEGIPGENEDEMIDDEEAGGRANLMEMAKQVDLKEMHAVLSHDKRYRIFDHLEEEREQWMRDYLSNLAESTATVHRPQ